LRSGNLSRIESAVQDLSIFGNNNIGDIICTLSICSQATCCEQGLESKIANTALRVKITQQYRSFVSLVEMANRSRGITERSIRALCFIGGLKASKTIPELYRHNMMSDNRRMVSEHDDPKALRHVVQNKISRVAAIAATLLAPCTGLVATLWREGDKSINFDSETSQWNIRCGDNIQRYETLSAETPEMQGLLAYYGDNILPLL
jgi:hypothetical protein